MRPPDARLLGQAMTNEGRPSGASLSGSTMHGSRHPRPSVRLAGSAVTIWLSGSVGPGRLGPSPRRQGWVGLRARRPSRGVVDRGYRSRPLECLPGNFCGAAVIRRPRLISGLKVSRGRVAGREAFLAARAAPAVLRRLGRAGGRASRTADRGPDSLAPLDEIGSELGAEQLGEPVLRVGTARRTPTHAGRDGSVRAAIRL